MWVVAIHMDLFDLFSGGYLALDVFFAISGFLITKNLMALGERTSSRGALLREFFGRRVGRIYPALVPFFAFVAVAGVGQGFLGQRVSLLEHVVLVVTFTFNLFLLAHQHPPYIVVFGALWSLSVEEQFYVLYGLAYAWAVRRADGLRHLAVALRVVVALSLVHLAVALLLTGDGALTTTDNVVYWSSDVRFGELAVACLAALGGLPWMRHRFAVGTALMVLIALAPVAGFVHTALLVYVVFIPAYLLSAVVLVRAVWDGRCPERVRRLLALRPFQAVGRRSYSLYVFHLAVFEAYHRLAPPAAGRYYYTGQLLALLAVGEVVYRFVERPARRSAKRWLDARAAVAV